MPIVQDVDQLQDGAPPNLQSLITRMKLEAQGGDLHPLLGRMNQESQLADVRPLLGRMVDDAAAESEPHDLHGLLTQRSAQAAQPTIAGPATSEPSTLQSLLAQQQQDQPTPDEQTAALLSALTKRQENVDPVSAMRQQQGLGQFLQLLSATSGDDRIGAFGQSLDAGSQHQQDQFQEATGGRLKLALEARKAQQDQANEEAQRRLQGQQIQQTGAYQQGELGLRRQALEQDNFGTLKPGETLFSKKTSEQVPGGTNSGRPLDPKTKTALMGMVQSYKRVNDLQNLFGEIGPTAYAPGSWGATNKYQQAINDYGPGIAQSFAVRGGGRGNPETMFPKPSDFSSNGRESFSRLRDDLGGQLHDWASELTAGGYSPAEIQAVLSATGTEGSGGAGDRSASPNSSEAPATISVRSKATGKIKQISADRAARFLADSGFERVQ